MRAYYHHKGVWVAGSLSVQPPGAASPDSVPEPARLTFKADVPAELGQDERIRTTGRIEEPFYSAVIAPPHMVFAFRPPQGSILMLMSVGRRGMARQVAIAVEDPEKVDSCVGSANGDRHA